MVWNVVEIGDLVYVRFADPTTQDDGDGWIEASKVDEYRPYTPEVVGYVAGYKDSVLKLGFGIIPKHYGTLFLIPFGCILELRRLSELGELRRLPS